MPRAAFETLLSLVKGTIIATKPNSRVGVSGRVYEAIDQATNSSGAPVTLRACLAMTLRWMAGGSYWDISALFGVGQGGFFHERGPLWRTMYALETALKPYLVFDTTEEGCARASAGFKKFAKGRVDGCVTAVDGLVIRTRAPYLNELDDAADRKAYRNRKGCFGMVAIAGCDSDCIFTFFSCNMSGSTHDASAIHGSAGGRVLLGSTLAPAHRNLDRELPVGYFGIGDEAFPNCNTLLTPWSGRSLSLEKVLLFYF
jgi:hypothetical protein